MNPRKTGPSTARTATRAKGMIRAETAAAAAGEVMTMTGETARPPTYPTMPVQKEGATTGIDPRDLPSDP